MKLYGPAAPRALIAAPQGENKPASLHGPLADRGAFRIEDLVSWTGLSRSHLYEQLRFGQLRGVKSGRCTLVTRQEAERWLSSLGDYNSDYNEIRCADERIEHHPAEAERESVSSQ